MAWYKTGTVKTTINSNAIIGTGTAFISNSRVGDAFRGPDGNWYEVVNIASNTALSISPDYQGSTVAAGVYALAPMQGYVKDSADALRAASLVIGNAATDMSDQVNAAKASAADALASKNAASASAKSASISAATATTKATEAASSASTATTQADRAKTAANEAANKQPLNGNLTALSSQTGAADTLAFFTGPSAMTTTPLTTQGRVLLAQATAAAMRSTLGLGEAAVTGLVTGTNDNTPGRIPTVGYAGIGRQLSMRTLPNTPTNRHDVISRGLGMSVDIIATGDKPAGVQDGPMITLDFDAAQGMNIMFDWRTGTMYTYTDITPAPLKKWRKTYNEDNIADTIDNGGLIESGINSHGTYAKFRDGTLICSGEAQPLTNAPANTTTQNMATIFGIPFKAGSIPSINVMVIAGGSQDHYGCTGVSVPAGTTIDTRFTAFVRNGDTVQNFRLWFTAVGRWK